MRNLKLTTAVAAALTAASIAAPNAGARPIDDPLPAGTTVLVPAGVNGGQGPVGVTDIPTAPSAAPASSDGFDWTDAGIGAAAMLSMLGLGAGAASVARRSRHGKPATS